MSDQVCCDEAEAFLRPLTTPTRSASAWSEESGRTQAEVLTLFDRAVLRAKAQELT